MSPLQVVVAIFCLIAALFLGLYVLLLLAVQAIRQRAEQLDTRVAHLEDDCGCSDAEICTDCDPKDRG